MPDELTITRKIHFTMANKGRREIKPGPAAVIDTPGMPDGRVPRLARLMALAIKYEQLIASGGVRDQAELAELGHVSRARVTQVMNLLHLAPDIQEAVLHLPRTLQGRDPIRELHVRPICAEPDWNRQREAWRRLLVSDVKSTDFIGSAHVWADG